MDLEGKDGRKMKHPLSHPTTATNELQWQEHHAIAVKFYSYPELYEQVWDTYRKYTHTPTC